MLSDTTSPEIVRKHPLAHCEECPLREVGVFVPTWGPDQAKLAFVGEAPGVQEAKAGIPFTGPSGRLLKVVAKNFGIDMEKVVLTNACLCRPPDNATPPQSAVAACKPRLDEELRQRGIERVVALGATAAQDLLGTKTAISKLRIGMDKTTDKGYTVLATYHPAAALRVPDYFPSLVHDIGKLVQPPRTWTEPAWRSYEDPEQARAVLRELRTSKLVGEYLALDIECDIDKDTGFDHPNHYGMLCVGLAYAGDRVVVIGETALKDEEVLDELADLMSEKKIICHNGKFDLAGLYQLVGPQKLYFDTMLASYCLDERGGIHSLEYLAIEFLGAPDWKSVLKRYIGPRDGYGVVPRPVLYKYNAYDLACTYQLFELFSERLGRGDGSARRVHNFLVDASNELMYVELNGIAIDLTYLNELTERYLEVLKAIETDLDDVLERGTNGRIGYLNPRSPLQVRKAIEEGFKVRIPEKRNQKGEWTKSTDIETLRGLLDRADVNTQMDFIKFLDTLLKHRREAKLYGTYVKGIRKRLYRGRVYPTFLLHGTTSGRLSCRNPNLQNVPRESAIKRLFVPGKSGNVFLQADFGQAELRVLCFLARDEYLRGIFNDPSRDLFDELTPILYPFANRETMEPGAWKNLRIRVKAYVYGLSYGRTEFSVAKEYKLPVEEARRAMETFFQVIPDTVRFRDETKKRVLRGEDLVTPYGRRRRYMLITKENRDDVLREALAFLPQSTASDVCLGAAVQLRQDLRGTDSYIRNLVHDSILIECPEESADDIGKHVEKQMLESAKQLVGDYVQFKVDVTTGKSWGDV